MTNNKIIMTTIQSTINDALQNANFHFVHNLESEVFYFTMQEGNIEYTIMLGYDEENSLIRCFSRMPINVPEHKVIDILAAINLFNSKELFGTMFLNDERDTLFVRTYANVDNGALNDAIIWGLIQPCIQMIKDYYVPVMRIIYSETIISN